MTLALLQDAAAESVPVWIGYVEAGGDINAAVDRTARADVARFSEMGTPAVNFGAGDPGFAHKKDEQVPTAQITEVSTALLNYLKG